MRHLFCIILAIIIYTDVSARVALEIYPKKCSPFVVRGTTLKINVKPPAIVMIHNLSKHDIWMTHNTRTGVGAGWSSKLNTRRWSALALTKPTFEMTCIESMPGHEQNIACEDVIAACVWSPSQLPDGSHGIFWAGENRNLTSLIAYIERKGFSSE